MVTLENRSQTYSHRLVLAIVPPLLLTLDVFTAKACLVFLHTCILLPPANKVWGKVIFFAPVCHSVHRRVCLGARWDTHPHSGSRYPPGSRHPPWEQTAPREETPWEQTPLAQCMLGDTVNKRVVCILLECNLVFPFIISLPVMYCKPQEQTNGSQPSL